MSNEEAINILYSIREYYASLTAGYPPHDCYGLGDMKCSDICNALLKGIRLLEQDPKWIPVSERLPEKNGVYIVSYEDSVRLLEWFNGKWFFYPSNPAREETGTIIAWMPLPEPYKTESEGEEV